MSRIASPDQFRIRLKAVMAREGLNASTLARGAGLDRSTLSQLLDSATDRLPRAETLAAIAGHCRVSVDWLLGLTSREEIGAEIIEAVLQIEGARHDSLDRFVEWLKAAAGSRVKTVPVTFPDFLKTEAVLRHEYAGSLMVEADRQVRLARERLEICRGPDIELEAAMPVQALDLFVSGTGIWRGLEAAARREQIAHVGRLYRDLYPRFRLYLFDQHRTVSAPFSVFGQQRAAIYLGQSYLVLSAIEHVRQFSARFDDLIRAATVQPHEIGGYLDRLVIG
ncbi:MAG: helix-turn-helix domain-containing protein [Hyphomicrobiaceae bacterium]|nr:helix-turn-helix domain-containing protein [Hyphomicrobiaceae bacterium]